MHVCMVLCVCECECGVMCVYSGRCVYVYVCYACVSVYVVSCVR